MSNQGNETILQVDALSKKYVLSAGYENKMSIKDLIRHPFRGEKREWKRVQALKDISFSLNRGESLGIIGANGAGKSTLLKILSGITSPTSGQVTIWGRALSVLDIGTGFHPDLTGRENVFLNGEILGLSREEIQKRYEEIVEFSEIAEFIDKPVKYYSSGMYLRLAFSVVMNMNADLLLIDEVLAVGDRSFQQKCMEVLINNTAKKSLMLVSHNLNEIEEMCDRILVLEDGQIAKKDGLKEGVYYYLAENKRKDNDRSTGDQVEANIKQKDDTEVTFLRNVIQKQLHFRFCDERAVERNNFNRCNEINIDMKLTGPAREELLAGFYISDYKGFKIIGGGPVPFEPGDYGWNIPPRLLSCGYYHVNVYIMLQQRIHTFSQYKTFEVEGMEQLKDQMKQVLDQKEMPVPIYLEQRCLHPEKTYFFQMG